MNIVYTEKVEIFREYHIDLEIEDFLDYTRDEKVTRGQLLGYICDTQLICPDSEEEYILDSGIDNIDLIIDEIIEFQLENKEEDELLHS